MRASLRHLCSEDMLNVLLPLYAHALCCSRAKCGCTNQQLRCCSSARRHHTAGTADNARLKLRCVLLWRHGFAPEPLYAICTNQQLCAGWLVVVYTTGYNHDNTG